MKILAAAILLLTATCVGCGKSNSVPTDRQPTDSQAKQVLEKAVAGTPDTKWTIYSSADDKCEIKFPGVYATSVNKNGMRKAKLDTLDGNAAYSFSVSTRAIDVEDEEAVKAFFDAVVTSGIETLDGSKLLKQSDVTIAGFPAREFDLEAPGLGIFRGRSIRTPQRYYQVNVLGPKAFVESDDVKKFRDSFKMTQ